jgi:hypothetical protein
MTIEKWRDIEEYEGRYQISNFGRVKSLSFMQRAVTRLGDEYFRRTREIILSQNMQNCGYLLAHLHLDNVRVAHLVHMLVAKAFVKGRDETVNHKDGVKTHNIATNLEWASYTENHLHAVRLGLNKSAIRVQDPKTKKIYDSIAQAVKDTHRDIKIIRRDWARV